ncbi:MAG: hypothetical protein AAGH46_02455 [Bacteroidota bacterium]
MKRLELFEFEDFNWLPTVIRTGVTNLIKVLHNLIGTRELLSNIVMSCLETTDFKQIVDLGSGSGGPMIAVIQHLNSKRKTDKPIKLLLTDKYPNNQIVQRINSLNLPNISYSETSVDAAAIEHTPHGLKTMIASFHHMAPDTAKRILKSAEKSGSPILIYEIAENNIPFIIWLLLLPISLAILILMSLVLTLFVWPLSIAQIIFTYLIPIIPLVYAWDGQASLMRTYTLKDVEELIGTEHKPDYNWKIQQAKKPNGKKAGYYVFGYPNY